MYAQYEPPEDIKHLVSFFYAMEHHENDGPLQTLLPSATEVNGWQYSGKWRLRFSQNKNIDDELLPDFYFVGQQTQSYKLTADRGLAGIFGAALIPGTIHHITQIPAHIFTNNPVDAYSILGEELRTASYVFRQAKTTGQRLDAVADFYRQMPPLPHYRLHHEALKLIYDAAGCITVSDLCSKLHVKERYLQRAFREHVGIPPSAYLQIIRFNNVFASLVTGEKGKNLQALAMLFRYYDLSHFSKAHKKYFGISPSHMIIEEFKLLEELINNGHYFLRVQRTS